MPPLALVTGAAGGIGRATVEVFIEKGWRVIAADRREAFEFPEGVRIEELDVSDSEQVEAFFGALGRTDPELHALINNAAIQLNKSILETEPDEWDEVQSSNLRSIYLTSRHAYPMLKKAGGAIVNISSVHALATSRNIAAYAASKGGILALTRAQALEFGPDGIRVNAVLPGAVDTRMLREGLSRGEVSGRTIDEQLSELSRRTVLSRVGTPEEIARAILFLADSRQSSFVTGQALVVDGGAMARLSTE